MTYSFSELKQAVRWHKEVGLIYIGCENCVGKHNPTAKSIIGNVIPGYRRMTLKEACYKVRLRIKENLAIVGF